jgi:hypothetical protein
VSEPVEIDGKVDLAWAETGGEVDSLLGIKVAAAPPRRPFGRGHALPRSAENGESATVSSLHGKLYLAAKFGKKENGFQPRYVIERRIYGNGRLGYKHIVSGTQVGLPGEALEGAHNAELFVHEDMRGALVVARRIDHARHYEKPRLLVPHASLATWQTAQSPNHRSLVSLADRASGRERQIAIELSPDGRPQTSSIRRIQAHHPRRRRHAVGQRDQRHGRGARR